MTRPHPPRRTAADTVTETVVAVGVAVLVLIGFAASYDTLRTLAITDGGFPAWLAPAVPLSFDLGIVVLSLKVVTAARERRHAFTLRALIVALSAISVAVNGAASPGLTGQLLHAVPPAMFVICFETVVASARRRALANQPPVASLRAQRAAAWLFAPRAHWRRWRAEALDHGGAALIPSSSAHVPSAPATATKHAHPVRHRGDASRLEIAREALQNDARMSAADLAHHLQRCGHQVSTRTAQRIKAAVLDAS